MKLKGSIVIAFSGRKYLMVRHSQRAWEFPGGRIEGDESPLETAKREFREETGLRGEDWRDCGVARLENGNLALFRCRASGKPVPETGEIAEARYFTAPPFNLSFERSEYFELLGMAGWRAKPKTDYDTASREFDCLRGKTAGDEIWAGAIAKWGKVNKYDRVLDIGCGTGRHSITLAETYGADVCGLDYSGGMLSKANAKRGGCWLRADASTLPVASGTFDTALLILVLQHVDDEPMAISEAKRALRPGGRLLIATVSHSRIRRHISRLFPSLVRLDTDRFMSVPELRWHLADHGFTGIRTGIMRTDKKIEPVEGIVERFRRRFISTLALVPEKDFERNMATFERRLRKEYGDSVETDVEITFIGARKQA